MKLHRKDYALWQKISFYPITEKYRFNRIFQETVRVVIFQLRQTPSLTLAFSRSYTLMPLPIRGVMGPLFLALSNGHSASISREAEKLWRQFRYRSANILAFLNILLLSCLIQDRQVLCALLLRLTEKPLEKSRFGGLPVSFVYEQLMLASQYLSGDQLVRMLVNQLPAGKRGRCQRSNLIKLLCAAAQNRLEREQSVRDVIKDSRSSAEISIYLFLAETIFQKEISVCSESCV